MTAVDLSDIPTKSAEPRAIDAGRVVRGALQGPSQRVERLGNRNSLVVTTSLMDEEPDGRRWRALLKRARRDGGIFTWPQPGLRILPPGAPIVAATVLTGRTLTLSGLTRRYPLLLGQALSIIVDGQRFLHFADAEAIAAADGTMTVALDELIRKPVPVGSVVELVEPKIEGTIEGDLGGPYELERATSFTFTITEDE